MSHDGAFAAESADTGEDVRIDGYDARCRRGFPALCRRYLTGRFQRR
jgi:hypothetical protein